MRKDMHKVITERPRAGGNLTHRKEYEHLLQRRIRGYKHTLEGDYEDLDDERPVREGIRKPYFRDRKEFSDLINPLKRYLRKQVGRPWNKVWSEICAVLKGNGLQANHVKDHIRSEIDGITFSGQKYFHGVIGEPDQRYGSDSLYVNQHGILCYCPAAKKRRSKKK